MDTNVLVRYFTQDDVEQFSLAAQLIEGFTVEAPGFVSTVALVEAVWVLARGYGRPKTQIVEVIEGLLRAKELLVEQSEVHYLALALYRAAPIDYADAVIAQSSLRAGCSAVVTFDRRAASTGRMRLLA